MRSMLRAVLSMSPALLLSFGALTQVAQSQQDFPAPEVSDVLAGPEAAGVLLAASPSAIGFLGSILVLAIALVCFLRSQKAEFESARTPLLLTSIGSLLISITLLVVAAGTNSDQESIPLIPPSPLFRIILNTLVGVLAFLVCTLQIYLVRRGRDPGSVSLVRRTILALGVFGVLGLTHWGAFHPSGVINRAEIFTRFIGSKYRTELRPVFIFDCTVKALSQSRIHVGEFDYPPLRNPDSGEVVAATARLTQINDCPTRFSSQRWIEFSADVAFFDTYLGSNGLNAALLGVGYDATPTSSMIAHLFTDHGPPTPGMIDALALIDPLLLFVAGAFVLWAFNLETLCLMVCFFGCFTPTQSGLAFGSFLRFDWLVLVVIALCALRRGFVMTSGFLLGAAALLRVFPAVFFLGAAFLLSAHYISTQRIRREALVFMAAGFVAIFALASLTVANSTETLTRFSDFVGPRSVLHSPTRENIGSATLLSFRPKEALRRRAAPPQPPPALPFLSPPPAPALPETNDFIPPPPPTSLVLTTLLLFLVIAGWCVRRERQLWPLTVLSVTALPFLGSLPAYAYAILGVLTFIATEDLRLRLLLFGMVVGSGIISLASDSPLLSFPALSLLTSYICVEVLLTYRTFLARRSSDR